MESGAQKIRRNRETEKAADTAFGEAGDRYQYSRALSGCLPDETADRRGTVRTAASGGRGVSACGALFREQHSAARPAAAGGGFRVPKVAGERRLANHGGGGVRCGDRVERGCNGGWQGLAA